MAVDRDARWAALVDDVASRHESVHVDRLTLAETVRRSRSSRSASTCSSSPELMARAVEDLAADADGGRRLAAAARLSGNGPAVFSPAHPASTDDAGHGVADPGSMLLAVSLLLREGLGEGHAADTLAAALRRARTDGPRTAPGTGGRRRATSATRS